MSNETMTPVSFEHRCQRVLQFARDLYRQSPDWVRFFREVVGVDGAARKVFTTQQEYIAFERSDAFHTIQRMVNALRNNKATSNSNHEPTRVITVRLPESLHEALKAEANDHSTSMNKLCIAKLLQVLDEDEASQRARAQQSTATPAAAPQTARYDQGAAGVNRPHTPNSYAPTSSSTSPAMGGGAPQSSQAGTPPYRPSTDRF